MKIGNLVRRVWSVSAPAPVTGQNMVGFVMRIDEQYYGGGQAFKISHVPRGKCVRPNMVDIIAPTRDGIRDRVLVLWSNDAGYEYCDSSNIEVISE